jgi:hypothetical protein
MTTKKKVKYFIDPQLLAEVERAAAPRRGWRAAIART